MTKNVSFIAMFNTKGSGLTAYHKNVASGKKSYATWWNHCGIIHFEFLQRNLIFHEDLYSQQLQCIQWLHSLIGETFWYGNTTFSKNHARKNNGFKRVCSTPSNRPCTNWFPFFSYSVNARNDKKKKKIYIYVCLCVCVCVCVCVCDGYRCRKWTLRAEIKPWTRLFAFHIPLINLGNVCEILSPQSMDK